MPAAHPPTTRRTTLETEELLFQTPIDVSRIVDFRCPDDWSVDEIVLTDYDFWFVLDGRASITVNDEQFSLVCDTLYCFVPGDRIAAHHFPPENLRVVYCHFDFPAGTLFRRLRFPRCSTGASQFFRQLFVRFAERFPHPGIDPVAGKLLILTVLEQWISDGDLQLVPALGGAHLPVLKLAIEHMRRNLDHPVRMEELQRVCGADRSTITRIFHEYAGTTPIRYFTSLRVAQAQGLLREGATVKETVHQLGFADVFSFTKVFRRFAGVTPGAYAREVAQAHF